MSADNYFRSRARHLAKLNVALHLSDIPSFQNSACCKKYLKDTIVSIQGEVFLEHSLFLKAHSFPRAKLSEQTKTAEKYPSLFSRQIETIVYG